jgi:hypothetical protein
MQTAKDVVKEEDHTFVGKQICALEAIFGSQNPWRKHAQLEHKHPTKKMIAIPSCTLLNALETKNTSTKITKLSPISNISQSHVAWLTFNEQGLPKMHKLEGFTTSCATCQHIIEYGSKATTERTGSIKQVLVVTHMGHLVYSTDILRLDCAACTQKLELTQAQKT